MPVLLSCFLGSKCWNWVYLIFYLDSFLLCLLVVLSSSLKAMVATCGFVLVLLQLVRLFFSSRNILILLVWISTSAAQRAFRGTAATCLAAETCLMGIFCPFGWGTPSVFYPWLRSCWMAFVGRPWLFILCFVCHHTGSSDLLFLSQAQVSRSSKTYSCLSFSAGGKGMEVAIKLLIQFLARTSCSL